IGVERVGAGEEFLEIGEAIVVGVEGGVGGIEGVEVMREFPAIGEMVAIGVGVLGVGAGEEFVEVGEGIVIGVGGGVESVEGVEAMGEFLIVGHGVVIFVGDFGEGGVVAGIELGLGDGFFGCAGSAPEEADAGGDAGAVLIFEANGVAMAGTEVEVEALF